MTAINTDEQFAMACGYLAGAGLLAVQGERQIVAGGRKVYDLQGSGIENRIDITPNTTTLEAALDNALATINAQQQHDATVAGMKTTVLADFDASVLKNKTPAQIATFIQNEVDAWASLADARADLRVWLPILAKAVAYLMEREHP